LLPFFVRPPPRRLIVIGTSVTRWPPASTPISSSEDWYCG
jgi:hypothetical protein